MSATILSNGQLHVTGDDFTGEDTLAIQDHRLIPMDAQLLQDGTAEEIDLAGLHVAPGFIDLLVNGCAGVNFCNDPSIETLENMRRWLTSMGTTSFVPTLISCQRETLTHALSTVYEFREKHPGICPGLHLEGPFISPQHKGFHSSSYIRSFGEGDLVTLKENIDAIAYMTIAPEAFKPKYIIELLNAKVRLSLGHTACTYLEAFNCFKAGINSVTHVYNAMRGINGREPGLLGAMLLNRQCYASVIADGRHVHPALIRLLHQHMGDKLFIVSDAQGVTGMEKLPGSFAVTGNEIFVDARRGLIDSKGALAGTTITMMDGVKYLVTHCGYSLDEALTAATRTPAEFLGFKEHGMIEGGYFADLVCFDDDFKIHYVVQDGFVKNSSELLL